MCPFLGGKGELGQPTQRRLGRGLPPYQVASSRLATVDMVEKLAAVPLLGGAVSASSTISPGPRPTSVPCGILMHRAVWSQ